MSVTLLTVRFVLPWFLYLLYRCCVLGVPVHVSVTLQTIHLYTTQVFQLIVFALWLCSLRTCTGVRCIANSPLLNDPSSCTHCTGVVVVFLAYLSRCPLHCKQSTYAQPRFFLLIVYALWLCSLRTCTGVRCIANSPLVNDPSSYTHCTGVVVVFLAYLYRWPLHC